MDNLRATLNGNKAVMTDSQTRPITIFTPSSADENDTNAQNLTVKEVIARLPPELFRVIMITEGGPDPRLVARRNTELVRWTRHGNALRLLRKCFLSHPDIYFFPRCGPLDRAFFDFRKYLPLKTALVSYVVTEINDTTCAGLIGRSIVEADQVCANSEFVKAAIRNRFGVESITVYDGVDRRFYFPRAEQADAPSSPVVLYAGSFKKTKRVECLIEHAARWPNVQFRLAGRGPTQEDCRALCQERNCCNVQFLGHLTSAQLGEEMRRAGVFLFPSILEGNPQVLLQAAACGVPCLAMSRYRSEYVVNGESGFLVENDGELASKLDLLLTNSSLRRAMSHAAVEHAGKFTWETIAQQWARIFIETARRRRDSSQLCAQAS